MKIDAALRDYSADARIVVISALAAALGAVCAVVAWLLLELVALSNNLFYYHQWSFVNRDPWDAGRHWWTVLMPALGGLLVGIIARYLTPRVRGHGMPDAIETIVFGAGKVQPRVAIWKPIATAISIGSGGPFGAEGPVIITGGAVGSVLGQLLPMTDSERTILMVAGASAGMAGVFNCPFSATLLAIEILLFEWKPRSLVPVTIACVTAGAVRRLLLGPGSILQMPNTGEPINHTSMLGALAVGVVVALVGILLSKAVHSAEHAFAKLPIHWMWWPAIGGIFLGAIGWVFPQSLGVGYSVIQQMLSDSNAWMLLGGILIFKSLAWIIALGSETAGGTLAPLMMIGGATGAAMGHMMPVMTSGAWTLAGMTAVLAATLGCPLTSAMLALELTHNGSLMLPVLLACMTAYGVSVLVQPRSLITQSLSNRGLHLTRDLGVDPLETMLVSQAMHTSVFALRDNATRQSAADWLHTMETRGPNAWSDWQRVFPLVDAEGHFAGMLTRTQMMSAAHETDLASPLIDSANRRPLTITPGQTLRACAIMMAESNLTAFPVVDAHGTLAGVITVNDLLKGRSREARREGERARVLRLRWPFGARNGEQLKQVETAVTMTPSAEDELDPDSPIAQRAAQDEASDTRR